MLHVLHLIVADGEYTWHVEPLAGEVGRHSKESVVLVTRRTLYADKRNGFVLAPDAVVPSVTARRGQGYLFAGCQTGCLSEEL